MCSRLCKVAEESLFHVCCSENESRRGCELHQSTKAPKHQSTGRQCTSAPNAVHQDSAHQSRGVQSGCSAPRNPHPPSSSFPPAAFCWARLVRSIFENQKSTSAPSPLGTFSLSQPAQPELLRAFSFSFFLTLAALEGRILIEIRKIGEA